MVCYFSIKSMLIIIYFSLLDGEDIICFEVEFNSFPDLVTFPDFRELDKTEVDSFSDPIHIPGGLLFGNKIVSTLYVRIFGNMQVMP